MNTETPPSSDPLFDNNPSDLMRAAIDPATYVPTGDPRAWQPPTPEDLQAWLGSAYLIEAFLARGGMGAVYRGIQVSLERPVAIKILPPQLRDIDPSFAQRFKQEAMAMAQLNHPGIVSVYDFGEMADGTLFFVMEYIDGTDVAQMVREQGRLSSAHAMAITAHVCDALQYAHENGVVHRDIKPANIMVGYNGSVKVADFGLAKSVHQQNTSLTLSGHVMGTPHFLAPEALTLGMGIDHRADIFAVGVMLYQMLTGKLPQGLFEMPSMQVPGLDPRYDAIVAGAMREDREQRYQRILDMRHALDAILTQPVPKPEASQQTLPPAGVSSVNRMQRPTGQPIRPVQRQASVPAQKKKSHAGWFALGAVVAVSSSCFFWLQQKPVNKELVPATSGVANEQSVTPSGGIQIKLPLVPHEVAKRFPEGRGFESHWSTEKPADLTGLPDKLTTPLFNTHVFNASNRSGPQKYYLVLDDPNGSSPRLFVDGNGNGNLSDDPVAVWRTGKYRQEGWIRSAVGQGSALIQLKIGNETKEVGLIIYYSPSSQKNEFDSMVELDYARMGNIQVEGKNFLAALVDCSSADFSEPGSLFCLDLDNDGFFSRKNEMFPVTETIPVGGQNYHLSGLDSSGAAFQLAKATPFINSLGMKFVPVPGTNVLFCIHETRNKDYAAYAAETLSVDDKWKHPVFDVWQEKHTIANDSDHPVTFVSWEDGKAFCAWLSSKEGRTYRLPTDHEWSCAAGIGDQENFRETPEAKSGKAPGYPWGASFPPANNNIGNYWDGASTKQTPTSHTVLNGYEDGHLVTAPVMSYGANKFGIYDLGGNVWEWCEDLYKPEYLLHPKDRQFHVLRGASWHVNDRDYYASSVRFNGRPTDREKDQGFRCALEAVPVSQKKH